VRSPDGAGNYSSDDGFSSSRSGVTVAPDDSDEIASKAAAGKSSKQLLKEDLDIGGFYLERKNWKAAQARFATAFALNKESPDAVWGLAESERHLQMYADAAEHYKLFLSYEPDGKRGREAKKALDEVESARPAAAKKPGTPDGTLN
jgi:tetratricopeptide (TPR) repeat protein